MDTTIVQEFITLAQRQNLTATAADLGVSKSTLSKHVSLLEEELGLTLLERSTAGVRLTQQGSDLFSSLFALVAAWDDVQEQALNIRNGVKPRLTVSSITDNQLVTNALTTLYSTLSTRHTAFAMENVLPKREKLPEQLHNMQLDILFDYLWPESLMEGLDITAVPIGEIPLVAVVRREHRLACNEAISIAQLEGEPIVRVKGHERDWCWVYIRDMCHNHGFEPEFRSFFGSQIIDLMMMPTKLQSEVLIISESYIGPSGFSTSPLVKVIPLLDEDAFYPQGAMFNPKNTNPLLAEALGLIGINTPAPLS